MRLKARFLLSAAAVAITVGGVAAPAAQAAPVEESAGLAPISVAMRVVPHAKKPGQAAPNVVITADCGTAFLYPSRAGSHVHYDFGFRNLSIHPLWVSGQVHASNVDNGEVDGDSYSGPSFSTSWEKQGNLYTGVGETLVTAHIYATGLLYDCESSPSLFQWIYNY